MIHHFNSDKHLLDSISCDVNWKPFYAQIIYKLNHIFVIQIIIELLFALYNYKQETEKQFILTMN